jgi:histidyl-tRNA synthetase
VFAAHGFVEIETRAVEPLGELLRKGETSQEVYVLRRLQDADRQGYDSRTLGLHFDLTVPLARYVLENAGQLDFPFKRSQIQKVWRGERPQEGRFREFVQADLDVIGLAELPFHYEVELPLIMAEALAALQVGSFRVLVNNRKLAEGLMLGLGVEDVGAALGWVDKVDKIGADGLLTGLTEFGLDTARAQAVTQFAAIQAADAAALSAAVRQLTTSLSAEGLWDANRQGAGELLDQGLAELTALLDAAQRRVPGTVVAAMKIVRGLDYYTGSVYETVWLEQEDLGSVCSGGRYDSLAKQGDITYPGVGLSIGVTRLISRILALGLLRPNRISPSVVVVAVLDEGDRAASDKVAAALRARGIAAETSPTAAKLGKQIRYADRLGVPFVWFPGVEGEADQVKDIRSGDQTVADAATWAPPPADLQIQFTAQTDAAGAEN